MSFIQAPMQFGYSICLLGNSLHAYCELLGVELCYKQKENLFCYKEVVVYVHKMSKFQEPVGPWP